MKLLYLTHDEVYQALIDNKKVEFMDRDDRYGRWQPYNPAIYAPEYAGRVYRLAEINPPAPKFEEAVGYVPVFQGPPHDPETYRLYEYIYPTVEELCVALGSGNPVSYMEVKYMRRVDPDTKS